MKTENIYNPGESQATASLHQLVDELIKTALPVAGQNRNSIVNNIPSRLLTGPYQQVIASVILGMLNAIVSNSTDSVAYISAKEWASQIVELSIKDDHCYNTYAVALALQDVLPVAEKIGGHLNITNQKQMITTIYFRFPV